MHPVVTKIIEINLEYETIIEAIREVIYEHEGKIDKGDGYKFILGVEVPVTTLCPCSKEISDNGAHNQRAFIRVRVSYDDDQHIWIEDLIDMVEGCASCPVYPLLKREDEKFVTEKAWDNPKFVEDVLRDVVVKLRGASHGCAEACPLSGGELRILTYSTNR